MSSIRKLTIPEERKWGGNFQVKMGINPGVRLKN